MNLRDQKKIYTIDQKWKNFKSLRACQVFQYSDKHEGWLTMNERENMLETILNILNKYHRAYGID